jgi:hypothetical protein
MAFQYLIWTPVVLNENPSLAEILWNFSRFKDERRLTLTQNPHFYTYLPASPEAYGGEFEIEPTEDFQHANKFYVLTDRPGLVYIKTDQYSRCFGNSWYPNGAVIFKGEHILFSFPFLCAVSHDFPDLRGRLQGEKVIKASLHTTQWRFCTQPLGSNYPEPERSGNGHRRRLTLALECPCENWKQQIDNLHYSGKSTYLNLRVCSGRLGDPFSSPVRCNIN